MEPSVNVFHLESRRRVELLVKWPAVQVLKGFMRAR